MDEKASPLDSSSPSEIVYTSEEYSFIDEITQFENEGTQITCYADFYLKSFNILKKYIVTQNDDDILSKIVVLLTAMYFWIQDYANRTNVFMSKKCFEKYDKKLRASTEKMIKYLCFIIVAARMMEFDYAETFLQEWISYSSHKKMLFTKLIESCEKYYVGNRQMNQDVSELSDKNVFEKYIKNAYSAIADKQRIYPLCYRYYDYVRRDDERRVDESFAAEPQTSKNPKNNGKPNQQNSRNQQNNGNPNQQKVGKPNQQNSRNQQKVGKPNQQTAEIVVADSAVTIPAAATAAIEDDSGYTMVVAPTIQIRYLLKSQDYDLIKRDVSQISEPICRGLDDCTPRFQNKLSGKYLNIYVGDLQVAHISYYHHSNDLYHFKIDSPSHFELPVLAPPLQYTVPFNFHINTRLGKITFATRDIDNPATEMQCPRQIVRIVKESLEIHLATLHTVERPATGRGHKLHRSRRCRRGCKSKRKRTMRRRLRA